MPEKGGFSHEAFRFSEEDKKKKQKEEEQSLGVEHTLGSSDDKNRDIYDVQNVVLDMSGLDALAEKYGTDDFEEIAKKYGWEVIADAIQMRTHEEEAERQRQENAHEEDWNAIIEEGQGELGEKKVDATPLKEEDEDWGKIINEGVGDVGAGEEYDAPTYFEPPELSPIQDTSPFSQPREPDTLPNVLEFGQNIVPAADDSIPLPKINVSFSELQGGHTWMRAENEGVEQGHEYRESGFVAAADMIKDGYRDGGGRHYYDPVANRVGGSREVVLIDREKDKKLAGYIERTREMVDMLEERGFDEKFIMSFVANWAFRISTKNWSQRRDHDSNNYRDQEVLLGDWNAQNQSVCRHRSPLFKILADSHPSLAGKVAMVRGGVEMIGRTGKHVWNVVQMDGRLYRFDLTSSKPQAFSDQLNDSLRDKEASLPQDYFVFRDITHGYDFNYVVEDGEGGWVEADSHIGFENFEPRELVVKERVDYSSETTSSVLPREYVGYVSRSEKKLTSQAVSFIEDFVGRDTFMYMDEDLIIEKARSYLHHEHYKELPPSIFNITVQPILGRIKRLRADMKSTNGLYPVEAAVFEHKGKKTLQPRSVDSHELLLAINDRVLQSGETLPVGIVE